MYVRWKLKIPAKHDETVGAFVVASFSGISTIEQQEVPLSNLCCCLHTVSVPGLFNPFTTISLVVNELGWLFGEGACASHSWLRLSLLLLLLLLLWKLSLRITALAVCVLLSLYLILLVDVLT